jgi:hypothetical protein
MPHSLTGALIAISLFVAAHGGDATSRSVSSIERSATLIAKPLDRDPLIVRAGEKNQASARKYAQCMRAHGIKDFPNPEPPGSGPSTQSSNQFSRANKACERYLPAGVGTEA